MKDIVIKANGMACSNCEKRVQNAIKNIDGVEDVIANHLEGTVKIMLNKEIDIQIFEELIDNLGYTVVK